MNQLLALLAAIAGLAASEPRATAADGRPPCVPAGWRPDVRAARSFAARRRGTVSFSVRTCERTWERRPRMRVPSASVVKAMLLVAYLNHPAVRRRDLRPGDRALLAPMVRYSDNDTATRVRDLVGDARMVRLSRRARMRDFSVAPAWGLSETTAADQSRFFLRLPELTPARHRAYALRLLQTIVPEQRWGIGESRPRGWRLYFKGGWGSGTGAVSHQVALLRRGRQRVSLAIMTVGNPSHQYSEATLRGVARRLVRGLARVPSGLAPDQRMPISELSPTMKR